MDHCRISTQIANYYADLDGMVMRLRQPDHWRVEILYLKTFTVKNFRQIQYLNLTFNKDLNILIGENNTGKSTIIDALRLCFNFGNQKRDMYIKKSDFYIDTSNPDAVLSNVEFHLEFELEEFKEEGIFNDLLVIKEDGTQNLQLHFKYFIEEKNGFEKIRWNVWGGENEGQRITPELLDLIYSVYLGALRNASQNLRPTRGNRLGELFANLTEDKDGNRIDDEKREQLSDRLIHAFSDDSEWTSLLESGKEKVNEHLKETSISGKEQSIDIDFFPLDFRNIVDNLRMRIPIYDETVTGDDPNKQSFFEIFQNGLGYNNLIYTATVLGDLKNKREIEPEAYTALLIEEPEAHLHPQLQSILFNYLNELNGNGTQLFISSHSPTITAKADMNTLIVLQNQNNNIYALPMKHTNLTDNNKKYLSKFLDVTKSQLFFANGAIFVEGISEALLVTEFSRMMSEENEFDIEKNGIELVNIDGVAFKHFANLFNSNDESKRLNVKSAVISDDDRITENGKITSRAQNTLNLKGGLLEVELATITFEYELFIADKENERILLDVFRELHPRAEQNIDKEEGTIKDRGYKFLEKIEKNKAKAELAHNLLMKLLSDESERSKFVVPTYIKKAVKWVIKGE